MMVQQTNYHKKWKRKECIEIWTEWLEGRKRVKTLNISRNWNDLKSDIEEENEEPLTVAIEIPIEIWPLLKSNWFYIAEKVQFEVFKNSNIAGSTDSMDMTRVNRIVEDIEEMILGIYTKKDVFPIACHMFDYWKTVNIVHLSTLNKWQGCSMQHKITRWLERIPDTTYQIVFRAGETRKDESIIERWVTPFEELDDITDTIVETMESELVGRVIAYSDKSKQLRSMQVRTENQPTSQPNDICLFVVGILRLS